MLYELVNMSDPYTMEADSFAAALTACAILGQGRYGLKPIGHDGPGVPICLFGDYPKETYDAASVADFAALAARANSSPDFNEEVAKALDSVRLGGAKDRNRSKVWHDKNRSSMNDIGRYAWEYAKAMRGQRKFASVDAIAGNE